MENFIFYEVFHLKIIECVIRINLALEQENINRNDWNFSDSVKLSLRSPNLVGVAEMPSNIKLSLNRIPI